MNLNSFLSKNSEHNDAIKKLTLILMGHSAFQILYAACELKIFETLNEKPGISKNKLKELTALNDRPVNSLLLGLTSLELITLNNGDYYNSEIIADIFKSSFWKTFYDLVVFEHKIVYLGEYDYLQSLKEDKNIGLRRIDGTAGDLYHRLSENSENETAFYNYMSSWSSMSIPLLLNSGVFKNSVNILDVGGGDATNAIAISTNYPNAKVTVFELEENTPLSKRKIEALNLQQKISVLTGNMFNDDFSNGYDCIVFIHIMVIWSKEHIKFLLKKSYDSLDDGGQLIIFNSISSDNEDGPLFAALDSVYFMSIPANGGMIYPWKFYESCLLESGFTEIKKIKFDVWSPHGAIVAIK